MYTGGFTFILWHLTPGSTPGVGARGKYLELLKLLYFEFFSGAHILTATDQKALTLGPNVTWRNLLDLSQMFMPRGGAKGQNPVQLLRTEFLKFL